jgi:hypothetical protein
MTKGKPGPKRLLSDEERKRRAALRAKKWREKHPKSWELITKRAYAKRKLKRERKGRGVEVELVLDPVSDMCDPGRRW